MSSANFQESPISPASMIKIRKIHLAQIIGFAAVYFLLLPLFPNAAMGPYDAINPHHLARLVFAIALIETAGNIAMALAKRHHAFLLTGFLGGFTSSIATIIAMGSMARINPEITRNAASGAMISNAATYILMAVLIALASPETLIELALPLLAGGLATAFYCRFMHTRARSEQLIQLNSNGSFSSVKRALIIVAILGGMLILIAALQEELGARGLFIASFMSGFVDGHASAVSVSEMVALGRIPVDKALVPIILGLTSNTLIRCVASFLSGNRKFAIYVSTGLLLANILTWLTLWAMQ